MLDKHVQFLETAFIQQHGNTFTGCIFSFCVLFLDCFLATAQTSLGTERDQFFYFFKLVTHKIIFKGFTLSSLFLAQFSQYTQS
ncbi:unknown [Bacteroides sp. CAG:714]|nr:unknown [Bacteroides sp. CAG:714]